MKTDYVRFVRVTLWVFLLSTLTVLNLFGLEIPLAAREWQGLERRSEVASLGVPLSRGEVSDLSALCVLDPAGRPVPAQFETLGVWPDGSTRWLLVTFVADCAPEAVARYVLSDKALSPPDMPTLEVSEAEGVLTVETGVMRVELNKEFFDLFGRVWLDHNRDGVFDDSELVSAPERPEGIVAVDALGRRLSSRWGKVESFEVEQNGPVRATIAVKGSLYEFETFRRGDPWIDYTARLQFHAGSGLVRVFFTLENHKSTHPVQDRDGDPSHWIMGREGHFFFRDMSLSTRLVFDGPQEASVGDGTESVLDRMTVTERASVYQESSGGENWFHRNHVNFLGRMPLTFKGAKYSLDGVEAYRRDRPDAWLQANDRQYGLAVAVRHFWQNFPKCLSSSADGTVRVGLWPEEFPDNHELQGGEIKTHEVAFFFHTGPQGSSRTENRVATVMSAFLHPLVFRAPAQVYVASGFFDPAATWDPRRLDRFERILHGAVMNEQENLMRDIETIDEYGWRNFGDTWAKNEIDQTRGPNTGRIAMSHYNHEYDHGYGMILQSLRTTGLNDEISRRWWDMAEPALRHESDIDLYHAKDRGVRDGVHDGGKFTHTAHGVDAATSTHRGGPRLTWFGKLRWTWGEGSNPESGHFNNRGMMAYFYLTGDRRVLESAMRIADLVEWKIREDRFAQIENLSRDAGHNLQILTDAYLYTWDERYREAAEKIIESTSPATQWYTSEQSRKAEPERSVGGWWTSAICVNAAARFTDVMEEKTGGIYRAGRDYVIAYADFVSRFLAGGPQVGFHSEWSVAKGGNNRGYGPWTYRIADVVMHGHRFSEDPDLRRRCLAAARDAFAHMERLHPGDGWIYLDAKPNTMIVGAGQPYAHFIQNGGWRR